ncbi:hypothetical protein JAAARDRAFT_117979 [Jaapia argillacea MUCL 33604]|uniref:Uncharacterized protein n=1 Tax=Jaapia argillacea MUCL 33604 TaxID=933084 RepID=A0A067QE20_9AGAM|nr:hypothetical protein JAAARDRAFT_117979 [Jaapia argillacea MUCL 33604]
MAKTLLKQYNIPKKGATGAVDDAKQELLELAASLELEEQAEAKAESVDSTDNDDVDGWVDEAALLTDVEREDLQANVGPVCLVLVKLATKIIHSTTKLLPDWYRKLEEMQMALHLMPRVVSTRWNSTFNVIEFALEY